MSDMYVTSNSRPFHRFSEIKWSAAYIASYVLHNHVLHGTKLIWNYDCPDAQTDIIRTFRPFGFPGLWWSCCETIPRIIKFAQSMFVNLMAQHWCLSLSSSYELHRFIFLAYFSPTKQQHSGFDVRVPDGLVSLELVDVVWNTQCGLCQEICEDEGSKQVSELLSESQH